MPSKSPAQARFMAGIAHGTIDPGPKGPSKAVAQDFNAADAGTGIIQAPDDTAPAATAPTAPVAAPAQKTPFQMAKPSALSKIKLKKKKR